jgi:hypothetical protein
MGSEATVETIEANTPKIKEGREPSWSDVMPYFAGTFSVLGLLFLQFTGNLSLTIWFGFVIIPI